MINKIAKKRSYISFLFLTMMISYSCVSIKKEAYLRNSSAQNYTEKEYVYLLQNDDIISVNISSITPSEYNFFERTNEVTAGVDPLLSGFLIDKNGAVHLPVLGTIEVAGLTIIEAQDRIKTLAEQYLDEPTVFIRLINFKFTLLGEVNRQNTFTIYDSETTILQALGFGGGLTEFADRSSVRLIRSEGNVTNSYQIDLLDQAVIESDFFKLRPGDIIFVDPLKTKNFRRNQSANIALILSGIATIATVILAYDRIENN